LATVVSQEITRLEQKIVLRLENVSKVYYGNGNSNKSNSKNKTLSQHTVLNNLSIDVREGEFITIVGPSGCGKSTLLNIVSGIDTSYKGDIQIDGKPISQSIIQIELLSFKKAHYSHG